MIGRIKSGQYLKNIALLTKRVEYTILFWPPKLYMDNDVDYLQNNACTCLVGNDVCYN